jgi:hypothetical protein
VGAVRGRRMFLRFLEACREGLEGEKYWSLIGFLGMGIRGAREKLSGGFCFLDSVRLARRLFVGISPGLLQSLMENNVEVRIIFIA